MGATMGCKSAKPCAVEANKASLKIAVPIAASANPAVASPTILQKRSAVLPSFEVQVVKPLNAQKEVMAAKEQGRQPALLAQVGQDGANVLEGMHVGAERMSRPSMTLPVEAPGREAVPEVCDEKQPVSDAGNSPSTPSGGPSQKSRPRRIRNAMCDWCDSEGTPTAQRKRVRGAEPGQQLENLIEELFRAHDLKGDGMLDEAELVELNEAVAEVHDSRDSDSDGVRRKYSNLFREKFDPEGRPVPYSAFRRYMLEMLDEIDRNEEAQEMMVEQFLAEARLARTVVTGAPILVDRPRPGGCYHACLRFCPASEKATEVCP